MTRRIVLVDIGNGLTLGGVLPSAALGEPYSARLIARGGIAPYSYTVTAGAEALAAAGLYLDESTGIVSGTATAGGSFVFTVRATDVSGAHVDRQYAITVIAEPVVPRVELTPVQMTFLPYLSTDVVRPEPTRAELLDFDNTFPNTANLTATSTPFGSTVGVMSAAGNILTVANGKNTAVLVDTSISSFPAPDAFIAVDIYQQGASATQDIIEVGIFLNASNFVTASIDRAANLAFIQVTQGGSSTNRVGQIAYAVPAGAFRMALGYQANSASLWIDAGAGWTYVTGGSTAAYLNLLGTASLAGLRAGIILASANATTWKFSRLRSSRFGAVGFRDPILMTNRDGTPYVSAAGKLYLTASTNCIAGSTGGSTRCSMFELDPATLGITLCGVFWATRGAKFYPDLNLHIVDNGDATQELFWATWGNGFGGSIQVVHTHQAGANQTGTRVWATPSTLALPLTGTSPGAYDCMAAWDGTQWRLTYSTVLNTGSFSGGFYPSEATSPDLLTWTLVGRDSSAGNYEGTKLIRAAAQLWVLAGGPEGAGNKARVYDRAMVYQGDLNAVFSGGTETQPHPMAFVYGDYAYLITFDNSKFNGVNFSWGKYIVQRANRYSA